MRYSNLVVTGKLLDCHGRSQYLADLELCAVFVAPYVGRSIFALVLDDDPSYQFLVTWQQPGFVLERCRLAGLNSVYLVDSGKKPTVSSEVNERQDKSALEVFLRLVLLPFLKCTR